MTKQSTFFFDIILKRMRTRARARHARERFFGCTKADYQIVTNCSFWLHRNAVWLHRSAVWLHRRQFGCTEDSLVLLQIQPSGPHFFMSGPHFFTSGLHFFTSGPHFFTSGPHFFMRGPHFFTSGPHFFVPGPGIFFIPFTNYPPSTLHPPPSTNKHNPGATKKSLTRVRYAHARVKDYCVTSSATL